MPYFDLRRSGKPGCFSEPPVYVCPPGDIAFFGTDLNAGDLAVCYANGIFPWPSSDRDLIPFYCPRRRYVLEPADLRVSHSLRRTVAKGLFSVRCDTAFAEVVAQCAAAKRPGQRGTWITHSYIEAMIELNKRGLAHSVEAYDAGGALCGGFYGTCVGLIFGGESMFTRISDSTKVAFVYFVRRAQRFGFRLIDCQDYTPNMERYGAKFIDRADFLARLKQCGGCAPDPEMWQF